MARFNLRRKDRERKILIAKDLMEKYLSEWEREIETGEVKGKNCFYYATKAEYAVLSDMCRLIRGELHEAHFEPEEYRFLKEIARAKQIKYGKFTHDFLKEGGE